LDLPLAGLTAAHLMSRDLVTVSPGAPLAELAAKFRAHQFKTLPVVDQGHYLGLVAEAALIGRADPNLLARDLFQEIPPATPDTPAALLVQRLADGQDQAVPVVHEGHLAGLVTRSDLIALLARPMV
jgi:CBS domain-containing membrane protein